MLALDGVTKRYGDICALDGLSVAVPDDRYVSLLGASGGGKTTLLRIIAGFEEPDAGAVSFNGARLDGMPPHRRGIGFVFQNFALFPHLSVFDNIVFGLRFREADRVGDPAEVSRRAAATIRLVGLDGLEERGVAAISGGQRQRVALARTLVTEPQVVLLDEPLGALDANLRERMCDELKAIRQRLGVTFLHVTGSDSEALIMGDVVAVLAHGKIAQIAPAQALYTQPGSAEVARRLNAYNLLSGTLDRGYFNSPAGRFPIAADDIVDGTPIDVALRYDRIAARPLVATDTSVPGILARFITSEFTGASILSFFRSVDGELLQVVTHLSGPQPDVLEVNRDYHLSFDPNDAILFPKGAQYGG